MANVIVDFEPFLVLSFNLDLKYGYPLHGFFHTYVGGGIVDLVLAYGMALIYRTTGKEYNMERLGITALSGVFLHYNTRLDNASRREALLSLKL
ncbi:hypothetical protein CHITON_2014 [Thermococcus chitonophagus]|uniref:Uncharacterized protein n=2 Tax=Thermococcus chitonophagus TaxID=54262 RepID=A0A170SWX5_9EURY|nr:hypothetical protein CHITON_2014 [Thermococcus chitonophagus]